jgi:hypothetical protein
VSEIPTFALPIDEKEKKLRQGRRERLPLFVLIDEIA